MGKSKISADVGKEILYLAKELLKEHMIISQFVNTDVNYILFKHQVNIHAPRYDFLNKKEWLFVFKLELNLLQFLEIISEDENNRMFDMLQSDEDNIYMAVLSLKQFINQKKEVQPISKFWSKEEYFKIATPELMMFKIKHKL
jgi:hypothetical protein